MVSSPSFSYSPLADARRQIRLLRILPGQLEDPIQCQISTHDLAEAEDGFVAISYTWGKAGNEEEIEINGRGFLVRQNCRYALWQMRNHAANGQCDLQYWIDSVCINQDHTEEKSNQVRLMGQIFSKARYVAACIGELDDTFLALLSLPSCDSIGNSQSGLTPLSAREGEILDIRHRSATREYFKRLWVAQESVLAKDVIIYCGLRTMGYSEWEQKRNIPSWLPDDMLPRFVDDFPPGLLRSICQLSGRACTDLHDKLYALFALGTREETENLRVDYDQSLWSMLVDFAATLSLVMASPSLGFLSHSIRILAREFSTDGAFIEDVRRFVGQRMIASTSLRTQATPRENMLRLHGTSVGYLSEQVARSAHCGGGHHLEDCLQQEKHTVHSMLWFDPTPDFDTRSVQSKKFRLGTVTHNMWDALDEDHIPWRAFCSLEGSEDTKSIEFMAPRNARAGDVVVRLTAHDGKYMLCRKTSDASTDIVGFIVQAIRKPGWSKRWLQSRCGRCGKSGCSRVWNIYMHTDDFLSFSLLQDDPMALVCTPFTTSESGSYIELSESCEQQP